MRVLIISDIHANLTALETVLSSAGEVDETWCLGDVVGYGPDPDECVSKFRGMGKLVCILGNHDAAVIGKIALEAFNPDARQSIHWTRSALSRINLKWLEQIPERTEMGDITLAHGSPRNPIWEYLLDPNTAGMNFDYFNTDLCFVGHTHLPIIYQQVLNQKPARWTIPMNNQVATLSGRAIINPGSVGQPRDRDRRASFGILDTETRVWTPRRVLYNVTEVQERILSAGLPERHALRLADGW
jgi:predicted phosphodiesterase